MPTTRHADVGFRQRERERLGVTTFSFGYVASGSRMLRT